MTAAHFRLLGTMFSQDMMVPAKIVITAATQKVQPYTGVAGSPLQHHYLVCPLSSNHFVILVTNKTAAADCNKQFGFQVG